MPYPDAKLASTPRPPFREYLASRQSFHSISRENSKSREEPATTAGFLLQNLLENHALWNDSTRVDESTIARWIRSVIFGSP